jgi:hypothetical protein
MMTRRGILRSRPRPLFRPYLRYRSLLHQGRSKIHHSPVRQLQETIAAARYGGACPRPCAAAVQRDGLMPPDLDGRNHQDHGEEREQDW